MSLNVELIRASFEKAKPLGTEVTKKFYEILFSEYPASKPLFEKTNLEKQQQALFGSLAFIVDNLTDTEKLSNYLEKLGERHVNYNTQPEHYPLVGDSLLKTFAHFFGDEWTDELQEEWTKAYGVITELMLKGAKS